MEVIPLLLFLLFVYLMPTIVAVLRDHLCTLDIFILNLALGWLLLPWLIALVWSFTKNTGEKAQYEG